MLKKSLLPIRITALLAAMSFLFVASAAGAAPPIDFTFRTLDGQTVTSASLRGKVVVMVVGASWLPLSRAQAQDIQKLAEDYAGRDVEVLWVSTDSVSPKSKNYATDDQLRAFASKNNLRVRVVRDPDGEIVKGLGADQLPAVIVLDKQGQVAGAPLGGFDPKASLADQVSPRLAKLL